jgi:hypothetical protein
VAENTQEKQRGRPFQPGQSGNPAGKPRGARHAALLALDAIGAEGAQDVLRKVVEDAKGGDMRAAEILLKRLWPERKGRPINVELPAMETPGDLVKAVGAVTNAVAQGDITPEEGQALAGIIETHRRAIETEDLERRLAAIEATQPGGGR